MGYSDGENNKHLDEYDDEDLVRELERRVKLRAEQRCSFCERPLDTSHCRLAHFHKEVSGLGAHTTREGVTRIFFKKVA